LALSKAQKAALIDEYADKLARSAATILIDYRGLSVTDITELRNSLRPSGGELTVVKNTLLALSMEREGIQVPEEMLVGPTAMAICYDDPAGPAKALTGFAKKYESITIKGGILGARPISIEDVHRLAALPSREELLAKALAGMQSPISGLVGVLSGTIRSLAYVLQARADQLQEA